MASRSVLHLFEKKSEDVTWRSVKVQPAHATLALRVQAKVAAQHAPPSASAIPGDDALAQAMQQYVQTQQTELDKGRKKGTLSYDLKARVRKVGLSGLPDFPTEDAMIRLESASMAAHAQGRQYVSSAEARSPSEFRPSWTRTPTIDVLVGNGSLEENIRGALDARKQRSQQDRVDYLSYANFQGHVLDWGVKMVVTKILDPVHLIGFQLFLSRVAEEFGGARTAYYYNLLLRQKLAKELENGAASVHGFLMHLDRDILGDAKANVESSAKCGLAVIWRRSLWFAIWSTSSEEWQGSTKAWCWKVLERCVVIKSVEQTWCQVTLAATVRQRRQTEERCLG